MGTTYLDPTGSQIGKKESIADAADHQAVAHVVAGVAHVGEFQPLQPAEMLTQR